MKTQLTIEESARLIELGVDAKLASMVSWKQTEDWQRKSVLDNKEHLTLKPFRPVVMGFERFDCKDIFTLTDILSILPKEIDERNLSMEHESEFKQWCVGYNLLHLESAPELIEALNQLAIWSLENGHLKTEKK